MSQFIQEMVLSDVTIFLIIAVMMVLITSWAHSRQEYAGYLLGWLIGLLLMILMSAFSFGYEPVSASTGDFMGPAIFIGLIIASFIGLGIGFGISALVRDEEETQSRVRRSLSVALSTGFTLGAGYLTLIIGRPTRIVVAVFVLAIAIGAIFNFILVRQTRYTTTTNADVYSEAENDSLSMSQSAEPPKINMDLPSPLAQRIQDLRQRTRR